MQQPSQAGQTCCQDQSRKKTRPNKLRQLQTNMKERRQISPAAVVVDDLARDCAKQEASQDFEVLQGREKLL